MGASSSRAPAGRRWLRVAVVLLATAVLVHRARAQESDASDPKSAARVTTEQQLQQAIDGHAKASHVLRITVAASVKLRRGITIPQGCGPLDIAGAPAGGTKQGRPQPRVSLDGSGIKPRAPVFVVNSAAAVSFTGLGLLGGQGAPTLFLRQSGPLTADGCVFSGANNTGAFAEPPHGGAISCIGCRRVSLKDSLFRANAARIGGALHAVNVPDGIQVEGSWFVENTGGSEGGAMGLSNTQLRMRNCSFIKNEATFKTGWGGAIALHKVEAAELEDVLLDRNNAGESGGGISASLTTTINLTRINCQSCASQWFGGCMFFLSNTHATLRENTFYNGSAVVAGGAFHVDRGSKAEVFDCVFDSNTSPYGGAINGQEQGGHLNVHRSRFFNNSASDKGGAIHVENRRFTLSAYDTVFDANQGGALGGAIACTTSRCHVRNCTFTANTATTMGGALWSSSSAGVQVNSSRIAGNSGLRGGGMSAEAPDSLLVHETEVFNNTADIDGGGVLLVSVTNGTANFVRSPITQNSAAIGGGLMLVSAQNVTLTDTTVSDNKAAVNQAKPLVSTVDGSFSSAGSGGGIFGTQCGLRLVDSRLTGNVASANGGGAALQMCSTVFERSTLEGNAAEAGNGGAVSAALAGDARLTAADATFTNNSAASGGAVFLTGPTSGVAVGQFACGSCTFRDNVAQSKAAGVSTGGGALMATGNIKAALTGSTAENNTATAGAGGAIHCLECTALTLRDCKLNRNTASGPGGAASCEQCGAVVVKQLTAEGNAGGSGAALHLALRSGAAQQKGDDEPGIFGSTFKRNKARGGAANGAVSVAAAADADTADAVGAGGAVFVSSAAPFNIADSSFSSNEATSGPGGAIYHRACADSSDCTLEVRGTSFDDNSASAGGGGAIFTTNGTLLKLPDDSDGLRSDRNRAAFGNDVASTPTQLGVASGQELAWLQQLDEPDLATARRRLLQAAETDAPGMTPVLSGLRRAAARLLLAVPQSNKAAVQAAGARAAAGAPQVVYLESNNRFSLEVKLLDHWGSNVVSNSSRPIDATIRLVDTGSRRASAWLAAPAAPDGGASAGSLCARSCEPGRPCTTGCLSGATTVAFKEGVANFSSIGLSAPPNSSFLMQVTPGGLRAVPLMDVVVRVHGCGVGEYVGKGGACEACTQPQINLEPQGGSGCSSCPPGASCQFGFPTPQPGFWHSHPRSALFHACPNVAACTPPDGGKKLLAYQQLNKHAGLSGWHANRAADSETYMRAQCTTGRSGPLCSTCSARYGLGPGNVCRRCPAGRAGSIALYVLVRLFDLFLVTALAAAMLVVWACTRRAFAGSAQQGAAAGASTVALHPLKHGDAAAAADYASPAAQDQQAAGDASGVGHHAGRLAMWLLMLLDWHQLAYLIFSAAAPLTAAGGSMLFALLLTTPQSTLHWVPVDCLVQASAAGRSTAVSSIISSVYPVYLALAAFAILCLLKPLGGGSSSAAQATRSNGPKAGATQLPSSSPEDSFTAVASTGGSAVASTADAEHGACLAKTTGTQAAATAAAPAASAQQQARGSHGGSSSIGGCRGGTRALGRLLPTLASGGRDLGPLGLFMLAAVASLCYCTVDLAATLTGALQCTPLDPTGGALLPGERRAAQGSWWSRNLNLRCFGGSQVAAAIAAGVACIPLLLCTLALVTAAIRAAMQKRAAAPANQLYGTWLSQLWGRNGANGGNGSTTATSSRGSFRWLEAVSAPGVALVLPFKAVSPAAWWALIAVVFRIGLAILLTALESTTGSSVLLRAVAGSGGIACVQLLHAWLQPGVSRGADRSIRGVYLVLQVLLVLTVAAECLSVVSPVARAVFYTAIVVIGSLNCLHMAARAFVSLLHCLA